MNLPCDIIQDLLPLYYDNVCSEKSKKTIEEHLKSCESCKAELESISEEIKIPHMQPVKEELLKKFASAWKKTKRFAFLKGLTITSIILLSLILAFNLSFEIEKAEGIAMANIINDNELCLFDKLTYKFDKVKTGDIILAEIHYNEFSFKDISRVVAVGGDTVKIENNSLYINGKLSPYHKAGNVMQFESTEEITLDVDEYFVMGDNQENSLDSRFKMYGTITKKQIIAKYIFTFPSFDNPFVKTSTVTAETTSP